MLRGPFVVLLRIQQHQLRSLNKQLLGAVGTFIHTRHVHDDQVRPERAIASLQISYEG